MERDSFKRLALILSGVIVLVSAGSALTLATGTDWSGGLAAISSPAWALLPAIFATGGALIVSNRPRNVIGWLLLGPAVGMTLSGIMTITGYLELPRDSLTPGLFFALWYDNLTWLMLIFPLIHLLAVFPTGSPLSGRWRWLVWLEVMMIGVFVALVPASRSIGPLDHPWKVSNPIGFIPDSFDESWFWSVWGAGLFILTVTGAASSLIRYRRAGARERQQLKWLLLAFAQFAVIYAIRVLAEGEGVGAVIDVLFFLSVITIPAMIAVAVIWYRLFEIDIIIRKTVLFTLLTGLLVTVYLGSVFLVRSLIGGVVPSGSSLSVVASTLLVAALFAPARSRLQSLIDHRLFRRRYDAAQVTSDFAVDLRRHTDVDTIAAGLARAIGGSVQPASLALWIRATTPLPIPEALPEHVAG